MSTFIRGDNVNANGIRLYFLQYGPRGSGAAPRGPARHPGAGHMIPWDNERGFY